MSLEDFIPFYDYFVTEETATTDVDDAGYMTWLFGKPEKNAPVISQESFPTSSLSLTDNYAQTIEEVVKIYAPEDAEKVLQRINLNLCLTPFIATLVFLTFTYTAKVAYKNGRPFLLNLATFVQQNLQSEENKVSELELRMNFIESMITKNMKIHQSEFVEELRSKTGDLIESHSRVLQSTHSRLCDITNTLSDLVQIPDVLQQTTEGRQMMDRVQSGDSTKQANFKN